MLILSGKIGAIIDKKTKKDGNPYQVIQVVTNGSNNGIKVIDVNDFRDLSEKKEPYKVGQSVELSINPLNYFFALEG